jgi:hypothetical protein
LRQASSEPSTSEAVQPSCSSTLRRARGAGGSIKVEPGGERAQLVSASGRARWQPVVDLAQDAQEAAGGIAGRVALEPEPSKISIAGRPGRLSSVRASVSRGTPQSSATLARAALQPSSERACRRVKMT